MKTPKTMLAVAAILLVIGAAVPVFADINGDWEGTGTGCVLSPGTGHLVNIHAFRVWNCTVDSGSLQGEWVDKAGNHGYFNGSQVEPSGIPGCFEYVGAWYWISGGWSIEMGDFSIVFEDESQKCSGEWWYDFRPMMEPGTIAGEKVN